MSYSYAAPDAAGVQRPRCWADDRFYNSASRECRGCSFVTSCGDTINRARAVRPGYAPQPAPAPYYSSFPTSGYAGPVPAPVPVGVAPQYPPNPVPVQYSTVPQQQQLQRQPAPQQGIFPAPQQYQYGWLHDPLYFAMHASPPPMIPQLEGENFVERMGKNMARDMIASVFANAFWAARQWVWEPKQEEELALPAVPMEPPK